MKKYHLIAFFTLLFIQCSDSDSISKQLEKPVAYDDLYQITENTRLLIDDFLVNDKNTEDINLEINATNIAGTVTLNSDGSITYAPQQNYTGKESFEYTICNKSNTPQCSTAKITIEVLDGLSSITVDDSYNIVKNKTIIIDDFLNNDIILEGYSLKSIDTQTTKGNATLNENNSIEYTPVLDYIGEDSLTYTICDENNDCSTATITITLVEGIKAVDDSYEIFENTSITLDNLIDNDEITSNTTILSIDTSLSTGNAKLKSNGEVTYTSEVSFIGTDTFSYTICDDSDCSSATVTILVKESDITFIIPDQLKDYYNSVNFSTNPESLSSELSNLTATKHTTILSYTDRHDYLYDADQDPDNSANVLLMYTGESRDKREWTSSLNPHSTQTFNTEHIYPQSFLDDDYREADLHNLRVCDASLNSSRSNREFVEGSGSAGIVNGEWYPGDDWKGDVARVVFYMNIKYDESISTIGDLDTLLEWNKEDPISDFEIQRNNVFQGAQGNRNPFIDNPYLATIIWGGESAENKWE
ncbi:Ig-like domain-containing protein [Wenyingzhuangia sp. 2_MG-2023]|nr:Ig-like domain-containing protein [Wenyingzhuangia sp. 2_MG-2023]MDO6736624.1 Ig-like domain-containing protein [Wenyingzhuangia sp. 2_MG-2023]